MKRLLLVLIVAMLVTPVFAGDPKTTIPPVDAIETVVYTGLHPVKDKIDLATDKQATLNSELYTAWEKQTYPVKFTSEYGDVISIKKVEKKKDGSFGVYITATRKGEEIATHSPIWFYGQVPTVIVTDVTITTASAYTSTVKEDLTSPIELALGEYVHNTKLGKAIGDDVAIVYASNDGIMAETTDEEWQTMRDDAGDYRVNSDASNIYGGYTTATTTTDVFNLHYRGGITFITSTLDDGISISSVILSVRGASRSKNLGTVNASLITFTPVSSASYAVGDYDATDYARLSDDITYNSFTTSGYNNFTLYAEKFSTVSLAGNTTLMLDHEASVNDTALVWLYGSSNVTGYAYKSSLSTGGIYKPFLTITYTSGAPDTTPPLSITGLTDIPACDQINWTWTNPVSDFAGVAVYNQTGTGAWTRNVTTAHDLWTSLSELTNYGIGTHTYDAVGNMNSTWVNGSSKTSACGSPPVAAFTANNVSTCAGVPVVFTDQSTNTPTSWLWQFGEGNTSSTQNPTKTYGVLGSMNVNLQATNAFGNDWENKTGYITVTDCSAPPAPPATCILGLNGNCMQLWKRIA